MGAGRDTHALRTVAEAALECFTRALPVSGAVMYRVTPELRIGDYLVERVRPEPHRAYVERYWAFDPLAPAHCLRAPDSMLTLGDALPAAARPASRYYREFLRPFAIGDVIEVLLSDRAGQVFGISLLRDAQAGAFSASEIGTCAALRRLAELALPGVAADDSAVESIASAPRSRVDGLTVREREIAALVVQGYANKEICRATGCALSTVKNHLQRVFEKLEVRNRAQLVTRMIH